MFNHKLVAVPLGIAALAVGGSVAYGDTIVGNPTQQSTQANTNSQIGQQTAGGGIVVGNIDTHADNDASNSQTSTQAAGDGTGTLVGTSSQGNTQGIVEIQSATQTGGSNNGTVVGSEEQTAFNTVDDNSQSSTQNAAFVTIVGSPVQGNNQYAGASQGVSELDPGVIVGDVDQHAGNRVDADQTAHQTVGAGSGGVVVGSPAQTNAQTTNEPQFIGQVGSSGTVVGSTDQTQHNNATNSNSYTGVIL